MSWNSYEYRPYVSVAERQRLAQKELARLAKKGMVVRPIQIEGRTIARSFWGASWCDNLESYMDFANRLPRGRTYVRNGSVVHLEIQAGAIKAFVSGSELYEVSINIRPAAPGKWRELCRACAGGIGSLMELLQGRLSDQVMRIITGAQTGLFPSPGEIKMSCSCPDAASMCKHIAAVLYGVGARLDKSPELLFLLRSVNHEELIAQAAAGMELSAKANAGEPELAESDIGAVFGIELDTTTPAAGKGAATQSPKASPAAMQGRPKRKASTRGKATAKRRPRSA